MNLKEYLIGFVFGLVVALVIFVWETIKRKSLENKKNYEIKNLKDMLAQRMDIESEGLTKLKTEMDEIKKQNENLRITNANLIQKPGRKEVNQLQIYQKAVDRLIINSPGFGAAWQSALKESEEEFEKIFTGAKSFWTKIIPGRTNAKEIESKDVVDEQ